MYLQVAGPADEIQASLASVSGVTRVTATGDQDGLVDVEVDSERGRDIRRELASAIVGRGWGLLELRPMRMSLEDVFLHLTTEDVAVAGPAEPPRPADAPPAGEEVANA